MLKLSNATDVLSRHRAPARQPSPFRLQSANTCPLPQAEKAAPPRTGRAGWRPGVEWELEPWILFNIGLLEELLQTCDPGDPRRETAIQLHSAMLSSSIEH